MEDKKWRSTIWISLLLVGTLCMSSVSFVWANGELKTVMQEEDGLEESTCSDNETEDVMETSNEIENAEISTNRTEIWGEMDNLQETSSENEVEKKSVISDNGSLSDMNVNENTVSEDRISDVREKKVFNVVLPTEIPCDMVLLGEERLKGVIRSRQFYMENKGYEDVCVFLKGVCLGKKHEEYAIRSASVENEIEQGKKNVWIYLKWEDENGGGIEQPGIVMGDVSVPGEGEIVLKAPKRDSKGNIQGENPQSKVYFSFFGDINSDTGHIWEGDELQINLEWTMEEIESDNVMDLSNLQEQSKVLSESVESSNDFVGSDGQKDFSADTDVLEAEVSQNKSEATDMLKETMSISNDSDMLKDVETISNNMIYGKEAEDYNE